MSETCSHEIRHGTVCAICGLDVGSPCKYFAFPHSSSITFSESEGQRMSEGNRDHLKKVKKLVMILNMEHVIMDLVLCSSVEEAKQKIVPGLEKDFMIYETTLIRFRPHLDYFLLHLSKKFVMNLFTHNQSQQFIAAILSRIDPVRQYFNNRIMDSNKAVTDLSSFPAMDEVTIILDVASDKWATANGFPPTGFIPIFPYLSLNTQVPDKCFLSRFGNLAKNGLNDAILPNMQAMLISIHQTFFETDNISLLDAISIVQSKVFENCHVCIETETDMTQSYMELIMKFGGRFYSEYEACCTHLIPRSVDDNSVKVASEYKGVKIIAVDWLYDSCINYKRMDEASYRLPGVKSPTCGEKEIEAPAPDRDLSSSEFELAVDNSSDARNIESDSSSEDCLDTSDEEIIIDPPAPSVTN